MTDIAYRRTQFTLSRGRLNRVAGRLAYASGAVALVGIIFLVALYAAAFAGGMTPTALAFGKINDVAIVIQFLLLLPIALVLHRLLGPAAPRLSGIALALGITGMVAVIALQLLLVFGVLPFQQQVGPLTAAMLLLLGPWLVIMSRLGRVSGLLPGNLGRDVAAILYVGYPFWAFRLGRRLLADAD